MPGSGQALETPQPPAPTPVVKETPAGQAVKNTNMLTEALKKQGVDSTTATAVGAATGMAAVKSDILKED